MSTISTQNEIFVFMLFLDIRYQVDEVEFLTYKVVSNRHYRFQKVKKIFHLRPHRLRLLKS
jgi:hypothetical protein